MAAGLPVDKWIALFIVLTNPVPSMVNHPYGTGPKPVVSISLPALDPPSGGLTERLDDEKNAALARARSA